MAYVDLTDEGSETLQAYQDKKTFKNIIQKYSGEETIEDPVSLINKLLVPATKVQFEADLMNYFSGGK